MKHIITTAEAATILEVLRKIEAASQKSPVIMAALDIDKHDLDKVTRTIKNIGK
jgi:hypothetical protein